LEATEKQVKDEISRLNAEIKAFQESNKSA
jgi:hypothetical protein